MEDVGIRMMTSAVKASRVYCTCAIVVTVRTSISICDFCLSIYGCILKPPLGDKLQVICLFKAPSVCGYRCVPLHGQGNGDLCPMLLPHTHIFLSLHCSSSFVQTLKLHTNFVE